jgi:hypothetical protein
MEPTPSAGAALEAYAAAIASHDWPGLRALLADDATVTLLHTGERFGAEQFVAFNRDYPGPWTFHRDEVVDAGGRAVLRAHVEAEEASFHVATFGTRDGSGRLTDVVEIWSEAVAPHPQRSEERAAT